MADTTSIDSLWGSQDQTYSSGTADSSGGFGSLLGTGLTAAGGLAGVAGGAVANAGNVAAANAQAAADLASAQGYGAESVAYSKAAGYASGNVNLAEENAAIQQIQQQRQVSKTIGAQRADIAGAGFGAGGTGLYLLQESQRQGALAKGLIGVQGAIQEQGYRAQSAADTALSQQAIGAEQAAQAASQAAKASATSQQSSGALGILGGILKVAGPIVGSFFGPVGTVIGGLAGSLVGGAVSNAGGGGDSSGGGGLF